jgi:hypothetical protein
MTAMLFGNQLFKNIVAVLAIASSMEEMPLSGLI